MLRISAVTKFTLQDFPEKTACIVWFAGCNMFCKYCHNVHLLEQTENFIPEADVMAFLKSRVGLIDGVVLSGGECSLFPDDVHEFIRKIKDMGFLIKIDTNGLNFDFVKKLLDEKLADFIALDYKSPREKFNFITGAINQYNAFDRTMRLVIDSDVKKEIRTTVHTDLLNEDDINSMVKNLERLRYGGTFYIQNFRNDNGVVRGIGDQKNVLDREKIVSSKLFKIEYRNFF
ncbi:MAG: anaerobic ribonucleoside-triphosphate reductase activating protein [Rickettsiales bacterium]|nr:anaerobic ribonucleoside-triphosphate reductase activating protein [Rickettsiales bacterium]